MTIRLHPLRVLLSPYKATTLPRSLHVCAETDLGNATVAMCDTPEEAEAARLAFERVLLPRFTADEAIAVCLKQAAPEEDHIDTWLPVEREFYLAGMRAALEGLAAAGVFVHSNNCGNPDCQGAHTTMADKLDAAGIK